MKIFLPVSVVAHILIFLILSSFFPAITIERFLPIMLEVSMLTPAPSLAEETLPAKAAPKPKLPVKTEKEKKVIESPREEPAPYPVAAAVLEAPADQKSPSPPQRTEREDVPASIPEEPAVALPSEKTLSMEMHSSPARSAALDEALSLPVTPVSHRESPAKAAPEAGPEQRAPMTAKKEFPAKKELITVRAGYADNPKPSYPQEARRKGVEGEVLLKVEVLPNGRVGEIAVKRSSGHEILDRSALSTVKQWRFLPAKRGEEAISSWVNIPIQFRLQ